MKYIAPTDATEPPPGWSWAVSAAHSWRPQTGDMRFVLTQKTPSGERMVGPITSDEMKSAKAAWNDEAKKAVEVE